LSIRRVTDIIVLEQLFWLMLKGFKIDIRDETGLKCKWKVSKMILAIAEAPCKV